jgi:hypothetical protein
MFYVQIEYLVKVMLQRLRDARKDNPQMSSQTTLKPATNDILNFKMDLMMLLHQPLAFTAFRCISLNRYLVVSVSFHERIPGSNKSFKQSSDFFGSSSDFLQLTYCSYPRCYRKTPYLEPAKTRRLRIILVIGIQKFSFFF